MRFEDKIASVRVKIASVGVKIMYRGREEKGVRWQDGESWGEITRVEDEIVRVEVEIVRL